MPSTEIQIFTYPTTGAKIRLARVDDDGTLWFVAKDVCEALELGHTGSALRRLDADEKGVHTVHTLGGEQELAVISEPGLYHLTESSRKPEAKVLRRWLNHDVLPTIRKTGGYGQQTAPTAQYVETRTLLTYPEVDSVKTKATSVRKLTKVTWEILWKELRTKFGFKGYDIPHRYYNAIFEDLDARVRTVSASTPVKQLPAAPYRPAIKRPKDMSPEKVRDLVEQKCGVCLILVAAPGATRHRLIGLYEHLEIPYRQDVTSPRVVPYLPFEHKEHFLSAFTEQMDQLGEYHRPIAAE